MKPGLSLTVLVDNNTLTDRDCMGEPGLSFLLETDKKKILFDTGLSGLFLANAEKIGLSLKDLDFVVLSHGHADHTGGLPHLVRHLAETNTGGSGARVPELVAHTRCFWPKEKEPGTENGSVLNEEEIRQAFPVHLSNKPFPVTEDLLFLGEIPRRFAFERADPGKRTIVLPDGTREPDHLLDDSALAFRSDAGLVIITGCSHAGICNITEYAKEVCGERRVTGIIGGFHLISPNPRRLVGTGRYLNRLHLATLHACHCTSLAAKLALAAYCPVQETGAGLGLGW
jgi:7,8-dihydropterin-6-yl-methyl-4-(beta-D-ribofuranosyl)aminobenzene 5'-phosphate synthase